jgi:hypothetical protein
VVGSTIAIAVALPLALLPLGQISGAYLGDDVTGDIGWEEDGEALDQFEFDEEPGAEGAGAQETEGAAEGSSMAASASARGLLNGAGSGAAQPRAGGGGGAGGAGFAAGSSQPCTPRTPAGGGRRWSNGSAFGAGGSSGRGFVRRGSRTFARRGGLRSVGRRLLRLLMAAWQWLAQGGGCALTAWYFANASWRLDLRGSAVCDASSVPIRIPQGCIENVLA